MNLHRLDNLQAASAVSFEASQINSLATVLSRALHSEPNAIYLVPDDDARRIVSQSLFWSAIRAGQLYGEIHFTENADGAAVWIHPEHNLPYRRLVRMGVMRFPFNPGWDFTTRFATLGAAVEEARKLVAPAPHWYLMALGVETSQPARAIAASLINPVLERADAAGVSCYVEVFSEKSLAFYKESGFRIAGAGRISGGGPNFWAMTRTAGSRP